MNDKTLIPQAMEIRKRYEESPTIFSWELHFLQESQRQDYQFSAGQFNMLYLYGIGEVAISISSDPQEKDYLRHTIRAVGRITRAMQQLKEGDTIGLRGPFGNGWPLASAQGKDIVILSGGLGCAPTYSLISYILRRREQFGQVRVLHGVKHSDDLIFREQLKQWQQHRDVEVIIAADNARAQWPWHVGFITDNIAKLAIEPQETLVMMCGPEAMMHAAIFAFLQKGISENNIYLSMERNMECGIGQCGHCQMGGWFICKDGPIFAYDQIKHLFNVAGF